MGNAKDRTCAKKLKLTVKLDNTERVKLSDREKEG